MATNAPVVQLDRIVLTKTQLQTTETVLYQMADVIDRLLAAGVQYTKLEVPNG